MDPGQFTMILRGWSDGRKEALDLLTPVIYQELRRLAAGKFSRERDGHTLQPTELIHEAYIRLVKLQQEQWHSRAHFFSVASQIMRQILVDHARDRLAAKRNAGERVTLEDALAFAPDGYAALISLDDALRELAGFDERKSRLIELKYFGGLQGEEIAEALGISVSTVTRESRLAEAWLRNYMKGK